MSSAAGVADDSSADTEALADRIDAALAGADARLADTYPGDPVGRQPVHTVYVPADRFDAKRSNARRNIAFGHGEHFCIGASLARAEARISFERLLARLDDLRLPDPGALSYIESFIIRGLKDLPVRFRRRA